jgi:hypothetical protein
MHIEQWRKLFNRCTPEVVDVATVHDLVQPGMRELGAGSGHPSYEALTARLQRNPHCVVAFRRTTRRDLYGYAIMYPLTQAAVDGLTSGAIAAGSFLTAEHVATPTESTAGLYLSVVWSGGGVSAAGMTIAGMLKWIEQETAKVDSVLPVFARAASGAGHRLMLKLGMQPVTAPGSEVWLAWTPEPQVVTGEGSQPRSMGRGRNVAGRSSLW